MRHKAIILLGTLVASISFANVYQECNHQAQFNVGTGIYDITGPAAERNMMGYGNTDQSTAGIHQRLWARAFIFASPCNEKRIVYVAADLGQSFLSIKQGVIKKINADASLKNFYSDANIMFSVTHTHSGPGGYSYYTLYNLTTFGFDVQNYHIIVNGIYQAIKRANANLSAGTIKFNEGSVKNLGYNRSLNEYLLNPADERAKYPESIDRQLPLLRIESAGKEVGMLAWHAVHGTAMNKYNQLISGDVQGHTSYQFEKLKGSDRGPKAFVAAIGQAHSGDISPNEPGQPGKYDLEGIAYVEKKGQKQFDAALETYNAASKLVHGAVDYRYTYLDMSTIKIDNQYVDGQSNLKTCDPALGISMFAGTPDGEGFGRRGVSCHNIDDFSSIGLLNSAVKSLFCDHIVTDSCHGVKPHSSLTSTSTSNPLSPGEAFVPQVLPLQLFVLGDIAIVGVPFEVTTMAGRRLQTTIKKALSEIHVNHVIIAGLSNAYVGYVTTNEEYQMQGYEGASTQFGPWLLNALQQEYTKLATAIVKDETIAPGPQPKDLINDQIDFQTDVHVDNTPSKGWFSQYEFGDVHEDAATSYASGDTIRTSFWGGHPKNALCLDGSRCETNHPSFFYIQKYTDGQWKTVRTDNDIDTLYEWTRAGDCLANACSLSIVTWMTPKDIEPGTYRIHHVSYYKHGLTQKIHQYSGTSRSFLIK